MTADDRGQAASRRRTPSWRVPLAILALGLVAGAWYGYWAFFVHTVPVRYAEPADRFKYGSLGSEIDSIPVDIWQVLPEVCPDRLPGGYASLGFIYEDGHQEPIGTSKRMVGVERMGVNCAACHTGAVRATRDGPRQVIPGMPNAQLDFEAYIRFLLGCLADPRFNADTVLTAIQKHRPVSTVDALLDRYVIVQARHAAEAKSKAFDWFEGRPDFGPGRLDTPNSLKRLLGMPISRDSVGTVDLPAVWNQSARTSLWRHWDANSPSVAERDHITALITGATEISLDLEELAWIEGWLSRLPPPRYPFSIDHARASRGATLFSAWCASCHVQRTGDVTPIGIIGTDRHRLDAISPELVAGLNAFGAGRPGESAHYRKTDGYSNVLLDGVWARAPYLHNGSVASLADLLEAEQRRQKVFYKGSDVYDQVALGFVTSAPVSGTRSFKFDTNVAGNGNLGHEYGTTLSAEEKRDLLEYLKTL